MAPFGFVPRTANLSNVTVEYVSADWRSEQVRRNVIGPLRAAQDYRAKEVEEEAASEGAGNGKGRDSLSSRMRFDVAAARPDHLILDWSAITDSNNVD